MKSLEQQLDDFRLIRENEAVIDESYREVVSPRLPEAGRWVTVRGRKAKVNGQVVQSTPVAIPLNNISLPSWILQAGTNDQV